MMVGATGAGKSTLLDGMMNYLTNVSFSDDFRFTVVDLMDEEKRKKGNQVKCFLKQSKSKIEKVPSDVWSRRPS